MPATEDFNTGSNEGVGYFEVNQRRGVRWNATKAFLRPAMKRPNLRCAPGCRPRGCCWATAWTTPLHAHGIEVVPTAGGPPQALHAGAR
jgi:choline dehydrogenase-like flavoprotein